MKGYREVNGNLITLAKQGTFDTIIQGCNCFCTMNKGFAQLMKINFSADKLPLEHSSLSGDINKLGQIDYENIQITPSLSNIENTTLTIVNAYTQYYWGEDRRHFDYDAFTLCLKKINYIFRGKNIGLPKIGTGLAGGNWDVIKEIIQLELKDCNVTVVIYDKK